MRHLLACRARPGVTSGGYSHWRCQKRWLHGHRWPWQSKHLVRPDEIHRYYNYVWTDENSPVHFVPVPVDVQVR